MVHYSDVMMSHDVMMASQITCVSMVCSTVCSGADQRKCQSSASLAFVVWIYRSPVNFPHKGPVTRKMFPIGEVIMQCGLFFWICNLQILCTSALALLLFNGVGVAIHFVTVYVSFLKLIFVSWWRHQIETFSPLLVICAEIHRSPVDSPH